MALQLSIALAAVALALGCALHVDLVFLHVVFLQFSHAFDCFSAMAFLV